jgi:uncharacterized membrane protein
VLSRFAISRLGRARLATLLLFLATFVVALGLRANASALARAVGAVPFLYFISVLGVGLYFLRPGDRRVRVDMIPKVFAGIHLVVLGLFAPLWMQPAGGALPQRLAVMAAPIIAYLIWSLARLGRHAGGEDRLVNLVEVFVPRRMARLLAAEMKLLTMALFAWGPRRRSADEPSFTSGSILAPVLVSVAVLSVAEITVLHLIVGQWTHVGAWLLTAIGLFVFVYMIGLAKSLQYLPTVLRPQALLVRLGHFQCVEIPYEAIQAVRKAAPGAPAGKSLNMAPMSAPNLVIELSSDREMTGISGRKRVFRQVALRMDDAESFEAALNGRLESRGGRDLAEQSAAEGSVVRA